MKYSIGGFALLTFLTVLGCTPAGECVDDSDCGGSEACREGPEGDNICIQVANTGDAGPQPEVAIVSFQSSATSADVGDTVTLSWESVNASSCALSPGLGVVQGTGQAEALIENTTTFVLTCQGEGGPASEEVLVSVVAAALEFSVTPAEANEFQEVTIAWDTVGTNNCSVTAFGNTLPIRGTSGTATTSALFDDEIALTCEGEALVQSLPISVARIASLTALPTVLAVPQTSTLTWLPENVTDCSVEGGVIDESSAVVTPVETTNYTVQCTGYRGALLQKRLDVGVLIESFAAQTTPIASGEDAVFVYELGNGVQSCELDDETIVDIAANQIVVAGATENVERSLSCTSALGVAQSEVVLIEVQ